MGGREAGPPSVELKATKVAFHVFEILSPYPRVASKICSAGSRTFIGARLFSKFAYFHGSFTLKKLRFREHAFVIPHPSGWGC